MNNPFAVIILLILVFCFLKKRKIAYLGFPENDQLKKSRIMKIGLPTLGVILSISAIVHATIYFYIPMLN